MAERYERRTFYQPPGADFSRAETAQQLATALSSFSRQAGQAYGLARSEQGAKEGAQVEGTPKLKSNFTLYGRAYNNSALRNYAISQHTEIEKELGRIESESEANPDAFQEKAEGFRKGLMKAALPEARADIANLFNRRLSEGVVKLNAQRIQQQKELNRGMLEQGLETISDSISRKHASNDPSLWAQAEEDEVLYKLMIEGAVNDGTISTIEGVAMRKDADKRITAQVLTGQFEREIQSGDPVGFIEKLMDQPNDMLSDEDKYKLVGNLMQRLSRRNSLVSMAESQEVDILKQRYEAGEKYATLKLLSGQLNTEELEKLVDADYLKPSVARSLQNELQSGGPKFDDDRERFHVETNLFSFSEEEVATNGRLNWDTRRALIEKRRDLQNSWRSTQQAQEGAARIDRALGILPGMASNLLSEQEKRARDQALTEWYDSVDALPPEERRMKAIELSEGVISRVIRSNATKEAAQLESRLSQYKTDKDPSKLRGNALREYEDTVNRLERQIDEAKRRAGQ
jgi:hypothetical protein